MIDYKRLLRTLALRFLSVVGVLTILVVGNVIGLYLIDYNTKADESVRVLQLEKELLETQVKFKREQEGHKLEQTKCLLREVEIKKQLAKMEIKKVECELDKQELQVQLHVSKQGGKR